MWAYPMGRCDPEDEPHQRGRDESGEVPEALDAGHAHCDLCTLETAGGDSINSDTRMFVVKK